MNAQVDNYALDPLARVKLGYPAVADGAEIHNLVRDCPPLDLNSPYAYLLLCAHHAETCVRADCGGRTVGFVSAYRVPQRPEVLFVWQVAVAAEMRGRGLGGRMLQELLSRDAVRECRYLETTVTPSNGPSRHLFESLAAALNAPLHEQVMFPAESFGASGHEAEMLFSIGPINQKKQEETTR
jgi:L-2,4-diaminobutyric acid acetyltransferase